MPPRPRHQSDRDAGPNQTGTWAPIRPGRGPLPASKAAQGGRGEVPFRLIVLALEYFEPDCVIPATLTIFMTLGPAPLVNPPRRLFQQRHAHRPLGSWRRRRGSSLPARFDHLRLVMEFQPSIYFVRLRLALESAGAFRPLTDSDTKCLCDPD